MILMQRAIGMAIGGFRRNKNENAFSPTRTKASNADMTVENEIISGGNF
jgi:hypothetical protein